MASYDHTNSVCLSASETYSDVFYRIQSQFGDSANQLFSQCLKSRLEQFHERFPEKRDDNISSKINSSEFNVSSRTPLTFWPSDWCYYESLLLAHFSHWAEAWTHFQIWSLEQKYTELQTRRINLNHWQALPENEAEYDDGLVNDIDQNQKLFFTLHSPFAMVLKDAVAMINLSTLVLELQWYELLEHIELSKSGTHFLLTYSDPQLEHPLLVSTARVNFAVGMQDWLYFSSFFQSKHWRSISHTQQLTTLIQKGLLSAEALLQEPRSQQEFDKLVWEHLVCPERSCEVIRLTVSGTKLQKMYYLYLSQKRLMKQLYEQQMMLSFVVVEQPLMIKYYESLSLGSYCQFGSCTLVGSDNPTYKGAWVVPQMHHALTSSDYRRYKQQTLQQIKKTRHNELNHA